MRDFLEEMKKEEEITNISLKESKKAKKERQNNLLGKPNA